MKTAGHQDLIDIKNWFAQYVRSFKNGDKTDRCNIVLKVNHSYRVCDEILNIGKKLGLRDHELRLAETIALLHDIGRFEQYAAYKTFSDRRSVDHAKLGVQALERHHVLKRFDALTERLIWRAVECHNLASIPQDVKGSCLFYTKLLRDADKLDIWRVVTDYYHRKSGERNRTIELDLPDTPGISEAVYQDLIHKRIVQADHIQNLNDFKLLQIGWIFDIHFAPTLDCIKSRCYLEMIRSVLPSLDKIQEIFRVVQDHLDRQKRLVSSMTENR